MIAYRLIEWFQRSGRSFPWRTWSDSYRLTVVEILLQRTRAETIAAFAPSFLQAYPDWQALAGARTADLKAALAPIGLQSRRAISLSALAHAVVEDGVDPEGREAPGVGQYISRAVAVGARNERVAMVDSNWVRVMHRVFAGKWMSDYRYDARLQSIAQLVVEAADSARTVNFAMLDMGATVCLPRRPKCHVCPLVTLCAHATA